MPILKEPIPVVFVEIVPEATRILVKILYS